MAHYIDKSALAAEIEKIISDETESIKSFEHNKNASEVQRSNARIGVLTYLRSFLNTLEVKEIDLDDKIYDYINTHYSEGCDGGMISDAHNDIGGVMYSDLTSLAEHFYELGLKAQNEQKSCTTDE